MAKTLVALKDFPWGGRAVVTGDVFDVPAIEAAALNYQKKARFARSSEAATRTIERTDLVPEPSRPRRRAAPEGTVKVDRRRREYRRRDLVPSE